MDRSIWVTIAASLVLLLFFAPPLVAYWEYDGIRVSTFDVDQFSPNSVTDGNGGMIVVWHSDTFAPGDGDIYAQRIDATGNLIWGKEGVVVCSAIDDQSAPDLVSDGNGGAIIAWYDKRDFATTGNDIYAQRIDPSGNPVWAEGGVPICTAPEGQDEHFIIADETGGAIIAWMDLRNSGTGYDIYAQRIDATGTCLWTTDGVNVSIQLSTQWPDDMVPDGENGAIVAWLDYRGGSDWDVYAQRIDSLGVSRWTAEGLPVCTAIGDQEKVRLAADGAGGAIIAWADERTIPGAEDIYAQRINSSGAPMWVSNGIVVCDEIGRQYIDGVVPDGSGGMIAIWQDDRDEDSWWDLYGQRVDASGNLLWITGGQAICTAAGDQILWDCIPVTSGGAVLCWEDGRDGPYDVYAQRLDSSGIAQWTADGALVCDAPEYQRPTSITSDGDTGYHIVWQDARDAGEWNIYADWISHDGGYVGYPGIGIRSITDVPSDEGGWVRITFQASKLDTVGELDYPISMYNIWQRVDGPLSASAIGSDSPSAPVVIPGDRSIDMSTLSGLPVTEKDGRYFVSAPEFPSGIWEIIGSFPASQQEQYIYRASTLVDSTDSGIPWSVYMVSAHTTTPSVWYLSEPDSGYSVDNNAPMPPSGVVAEQSFSPEGLSLDWDVNLENDLYHYAVYRGTSESFVPGAGNRIAVPFDSEYFDDEWTWESGYYYKVSAFDIHGNESGFTLVTPATVTGEDLPGIPEVTYLDQNYPNPFNPSTTIAFGLPRASHVRISVYDTAGRLVRVVVDEDREPGHYKERWDGLNSRGVRATSGIYFYRLVAGDFVQTRKMVLLR